MSQVQINSEKVNLFKEILLEAVNENKISNWSIEKYVNKKSNLYAERNCKIESILDSKREEYVFTLFKDFEKEIGESSFSVSDNTTVEEFKAELDDGIFMCENSKSKKYEISKADDESVDDSEMNYSIFHNERFFEDFSDMNLKNFVKEILKELKLTVENTNEDGIKVMVNSFEFLNTIVETELETSTDINKSYKKNKSYMEFIITVKNSETDEDVEHVVYKKINNIYTFDYSDFFKTEIEYAIDKSKPIKAPNFTGIVVLRDYSAFDFFIPSPPSNPLILHCSARVKYQQISKFEVGKQVIDAKKDKLTIHSNPFVKDDQTSTPYDSNGVSAKRITLIENGVFKNFFASKKYATYIGVKETGPPGVIEIESGPKNIYELERENEYIEIISFAWFNPDSVTGNFSAEIRLGYHVKNGIKKAFRGGLFSGNVFKILEDAEFSKEKIKEAGYFGPKMVKFYNGEIIGE